MPIRGVICDLDDTLLKSYRAKWDHHIATARLFYGIELTDDDLRRVWGMPFYEMIKVLYQGADTVENMVDANYALEHLYPKLLQPGALLAVKRLLDAGLAVGILTAAHRACVDEDLRRLGFPVERFAFVQAADDTDVHKPHPGVFLPTLAHFRQQGIQKEEIVSIGDALHDYYAARDANLQFIGVTTGLIDQAAFESAGAVSVASFTEVVEIVLR